VIIYSFLRRVELEKAEIDNMIQKIGESLGLLAPLQNDLSKLASELQEKEKMLSEREERLKESQEQNIVLQESYLSVQEELDKISAMYKDLAGTTDANINIKHILSVYVTLLENVFEGKPHAKILLLLNSGEKKSITRQELNQTIGFSPAVVLHSIHELLRAELIDYEDDTGVVTLREQLS